MWIIWNFFIGVLISVLVVLRENKRRNEKVSAELEETEVHFTASRCYLVLWWRMSCFLFRYSSCILVWICLCQVPFARGSLLQRCCCIIKLPCSTLLVRRNAQYIRRIKLWRGITASVRLLKDVVLTKEVLGANEMGKYSRMLSG